MKSNPIDLLAELAARDEAFAILLAQREADAAKYATRISIESSKAMPV